MSLRAGIEEKSEQRITLALHTQSDFQRGCECEEWVKSQSGCESGSHPLSHPLWLFVAGAGLEPTTFGLWARRATNCSIPHYIVGDYTDFNRDYTALFLISQIKIGEIFSQSAKSLFLIGTAKI